MSKNTELKVKPLVALGQDDEGRMYVNVDPDIAKTVGVEEPGDDYCRLVVETLSCALAATAKKQVENGEDIPEVVENLMESIVCNLRHAIPELDVRLSHVGPGGEGLDDDKDGVLPA